MSLFSVDDYQYMARALELARRGLYTTHPNPRVGCVLVRDGKVIGEGFHQLAGEGHAEVNALKNAGDAKGATAYVTLEPCSHFGRTPPCALGLIEAGVSRVVAAMTDPNPKVSGQGLSKLSDAGIETSSGLLETQARELNPGFLSRMERGRPYVRLKLAMSVDGRTAMASGESKWITGAEARADVQQLRARSSAVITGIGSILSDDSSLTVRIQQLSNRVANQITDHQPLRVVLDSELRMPLNAKMLTLAGRTLIVTSADLTSEKSVALKSAGAELLALGNTDGRVDLQRLMAYLAAQESVNELLVETGAELAGAFIEARLVDELWVYMAPKLMGSDARPLVKLDFGSMSEAIELSLKDMRQFGNDIRMIWQFKAPG